MYIETAVIQSMTAEHDCRTGKNSGSGRTALVILGKRTFVGMVGDDWAAGTVHTKVRRDVCFMTFKKNASMY